MYIWIMLATIMVAFSFYNLSPRADKEDAMSRVKAASIITRFKLENNAAYNTLRCEILKRKNNGNWRGEGTQTTLPYRITKNLNVGYTNFEDNLPIGYDFDNSLDVAHYVYVLDNSAEQGGQLLDNWYDMNIGIHKSPYMVSFATIPDRWLSKTDSSEPLPAFLRQLGQSERRGAHYGWVKCTAVSEAGSEDANEDENTVSVLNCTFSGRAAVSLVGEYNENNEFSQKYKGLPEDSVFWRNDEFAQKCGGTACLFSYHKFNLSDVGNYCRDLINAYENPNNNETNENNTEGQ